MSTFEHLLNAADRNGKDKVTRVLEVEQLASLAWGIWLKVEHKQVATEAQDMMTRS